MQLAGLVGVRAAFGREGVLMGGQLALELVAERLDRGVELAGLVGPGSDGSLDGGVLRGLQGLKLVAQGGNGRAQKPDLVGGGRDGGLDRRLPAGISLLQARPQGDDGLGQLPILPLRFQELRAAVGRKDGGKGRRLGIHAGTFRRFGGTGKLRIRGGAGSPAPQSRSAASSARRERSPFTSFTCAAMA